MAGSHWMTVSTGHPEPGQSVRDRVQIGREQLENCRSDPADDRLIAMGGEGGVLWRYECQGRHQLAAQTIHDRVGYRLTLGGLAPTEVHEGEVTLTAIITSFVFTN
jgi:hypothetical protein